jgi:hypothetical protein
VRELPSQTTKGRAIGEELMRNAGSSASLRGAGEGAPERQRSPKYPSDPMRVSEKGGGLPISESWTHRSIDQASTPLPSLVEEPDEARNDRYELEREAELRAREEALPEGARAPDRSGTPATHRSSDEHQDNDAEQRMLDEYRRQREELGLEPDDGNDDRLLRLRWVDV